MKQAPWADQPRSELHNVAYLFDIDGTLAVRGERSPYDWSRVGEDTPNVPVIAIARHLAHYHRIVCVSGRDESCRFQTDIWLRTHLGMYDGLFMRPLRDNRADHVIKRELYENKIAPTFTITGVFDDRDQCVRLWRELGFTCFQVGEGAF